MCVGGELPVILRSETTVEIRNVTRLLSKHKDCCVKVHFHNILIDGSDVTFINASAYTSSLIMCNITPEEESLQNIASP